MSDEYKEAINARVVQMLKEGTDDYTNQIWIWSFIRDEVIDDVKARSESLNREFTDGDIKLAIGRTLLNRLLVMTPNQYQEAAMRTCPIRDDRPNNYIRQDYAKLVNGLMGLTGEAGECADLVKKHLFQGHELDREHLAKELGDVAWYLAETADAIGYNLEDIFKMNIGKLAKRYPTGAFDEAHSLHRAEDDV